MANFIVAHWHGFLFACGVLTLLIFTVAQWKRIVSATEDTPGVQSSKRQTAFRFEYVLIVSALANLFLKLKLDPTIWGGMFFVITACYGFNAWKDISANNNKTDQPI